MVHANTNLEHLINPSRLAVDFLEANIATARNVFPAQSPFLKQVRSAQYRVNNPAEARVVADLIGDPLTNVSQQPWGVLVELKPRSTSGPSGSALTATASQPNPEQPTAQAQSDRRAPATQPPPSQPKVATAQAPAQKLAVMPSSTSKADLAQKPAVRPSSSPKCRPGPEA